MKLMKIVPIIASLFFASSLNAAQVNYKFTGDIDLIVVFDQQTVTNESEISFLENTFTLDDTVTGNFILDTNSLLNEKSSFIPLYANYDNAIKGMNFAGPNSKIIGSTPTDTRLTIISRDYDALGLSSEKSSPELFERISIAFLDPTGSAIDDLRIPDSINLDVFQNKSFSYLWQNFENDYAFIINGNIKSLEIVSSVPEPDSSLMLFSGIVALGFWVSRKKNSAKSQDF